MTNSGSSLTGWAPGGTANAASILASGWNGFGVSAHAASAAIRAPAAAAMRVSSGQRTGCHQAEQAEKAEDHQIGHACHATKAMADRPRP
ncbi:hypothetical protein FQU96_29020 [Reyranella sp. CPCC 100927]|nr:hypothetical protein FQU96_29020 [Reyranella sp. CPCC 100927]